MTKPDFSLTGKRALVTGSSGGIGLGYALGLGRAGADVILNGRDADKLASAEAALRREGLSVAVAAFDVTDPQAATEAVDRIERDHGPIHVLVNNAGVTHRAPMHEFPLEQWRRVVATNLDSVFILSKAVARHMIPRGYGKIITTCSVMSEVARPTVSPYVATKGAVKMLVKAMAVEWGRYGLRANGIGPGYFKSDLTAPLVNDPAFTEWLSARTPLGRWGDVEDLQGACVFLASPASDFVTGTILYVDGGFTASV